MKMGLNNAESIHFIPMNPALGAIVEGVSLAESMTDEVRKIISNALLTYQVLFFRNQPLTPKQQKDFANQFGDLHIHPIYPNVPDTPEVLILDTHADNLPDNDNWHTDVTFISTPPLGAVLAAKKIPSSGGDTLWSSCTAAYESLSEPMQKLLCGLTATHDFAKSFPSSRHAVSEAGKKQWEATRIKNPPLTHPVIRTHPQSGRKALFVNEGFTTKINDVSEGESKALLEFLFAHVSRPEFVIRWKWQENDVAFWDNRITQHYAVADYLPERRIMHRATILGDKPY